MGTENIASLSHFIRLSVILIYLNRHQDFFFFVCGVGFLILKKLKNLLYSPKFEF